MIACHLAHTRLAALLRIHARMCIVCSRSCAASTPCHTTARVHVSAGAEKSALWSQHILRAQQAADLEDRIQLGAALYRCQKHVTTRPAADEVRHGACCCCCYCAAARAPHLRPVPHSTCARSAQVGRGMQCSLLRPRRSCDAQINIYMLMRFDSARIATPRCHKRVLCWCC